MLASFKYPSVEGHFAKLLKKLLIGFIAIGFLMLVVFGFKSWQDENREMQANLAIQAGFAAKSSQAVFDNIGSSMELLGELLKDMDVVHHPEITRIALNDFKENHPEIVAIELISPDGKVFLSTLGQSGGKMLDFATIPDYLLAFRFDLNNTYSYNIGPNQFGMGLDQWHFPFRHTVEDKDGNPLFVIQGDVLIESAGLLWSDLPLPDGSRVGLIRNNDGYIQLRWPVQLAEAAAYNTQSGPLIRAIRATPGKITGTYQGISAIDGVDRLGAYVHLPNANMSAFVSVPRRLVLARWWEHNYPVLLSFIGYLIVLVVIAYRLMLREQQHTGELLAQSRKDPLTGLPNRIAADEALESEISRARRSKSHSALLYLDIDKFKDVNDKLGHACGDHLLEQVASRIAAVLRNEDMLARLGGDEFLILLPNSNAEKASTLAQRIVNIFGAPFTGDNQEIMVSTSIGICMFPDNGLDNRALLQNADAAMYEAKRQGGNCFAFYQEELGEHIRQRLQLQRDFQRALACHEFELYYQPLVDMADGKIVGAEALVRWNDPVLGVRSPAEFIPFAEDSGWILPLGEWVLKTACQQSKCWAAKGYDIYMAVNLSTRQFQDQELLQKISLALSEAGLCPSKLELEITESASMLDPEASIQVMNKLKALGMRIAIDDFGTGYSSLSYLKRIPADIIKIDRSFVSGIQNDPDDAAIVRTIMALAASMDKQCLAEGIETTEHFEMLRNLGCHFGQGYWLSRPVVAQAFEQLLAGPQGYLRQFSNVALVA
ncbi:EAL domain-containing protein [Sulfuriferula sp. AH1]|uniref:bifunctional diguanylate cyclase/phosphodiesterase n=1 Tax=Sulfuriferula sp. AH1 TaxID=1985873 RepID=UPI0016748A77|nr:EAL domain-containing protein [Sulfuriferula sp. AH1]